MVISSENANGLAAQQQDIPDDPLLSSVRQSAVTTHVSAWTASTTTHVWADLMMYLPSDRYQRLLLLGFLLFFALSCVDPPYVDFLLMQHVPTVIVLAGFVYLSHRAPLSRFGYTLVILFLTLHTVGARYLYTFTPYDEWSQGLTGRSISDAFGWSRNHYDRVVHFSFGLLIAPVIQELEERYLGLSRRASCWLAIESIIALSACYELLEWLIAVVFTPTWAESFLGQQGDIFDGQKDMALAAVGASLSIFAVATLGRCHERSAITR